MKYFKNIPRNKKETTEQPEQEWAARKPLIKNILK